MKTLTLLAVLISLNVQAKVADFHSLIVENNKAQVDLHSNIDQQMDITRLAVMNGQGKYIVDNGQETVNVPTNKNMLKFAKEKSFFRPNEAVQQKRLAEELSNAQ
jgi:hypothetical protein